MKTISQGRILERREIVIDSPTYEMIDSLKSKSVVADILYNHIKFDNSQKNYILKLDTNYKGVTKIEASDGDLFKVTVKGMDDSIDVQNRKIAAVTKKIMRLIKDSNVTDDDIDEFMRLVYIYKKEISSDYSFKLVEGSDINRYYMSSSYEECSGGLGNSCMRHSNLYGCLDFYSEFLHSKVKLLIKVNKKTDLIAGRALVWETNMGLYMDRIYAISSNVMSEFKEYGKSALKIMYFYDKGSVPEIIMVELKISPIDFRDAYDNYFDEVPYLDTFSNFYYSVPEETFFMFHKRETLEKRLEASKKLGDCYVFEMHKKICERPVYDYVGSGNDLLS